MDFTYYANIKVISNETECMINCLGVVCPKRYNAEKKAFLNKYKYWLDKGEFRIEESINSEVHYDCLCLPS